MIREFQKLTLLPSVGVVKEGFLDASEPHLGQLSNHLYNCVLDT